MRRGVGAHFVFWRPGSMRANQRAIDFDEKRKGHPNAGGIIR
jgi:hypothetical protein